MFAETGVAFSDYVELLPITPFYRLHWEDGVSFDYDGSEEVIDDQCWVGAPTRAWRAGWSW